MVGCCDASVVSPSVEGVGLSSIQRDAKLGIWWCSSSLTRPLTAWGNLIVDLAVANVQEGKDDVS